EGGRINPAARRSSGIRTQRVLEDLDRPLDGGGRRGQRLVGGQASRNPVCRGRVENLREFPTRGKQADTLIGKLLYFIHNGGIQDVAAIGGEYTADFVGLAIAPVVSPVLGLEPATSRITC